jgi:uncharacterized protein
MHVDTVLLKVASRCNLDCSYCYVYHMGDETWRTLPKRMASDTQALVAAELGALMRTQARPFSIVLHGGEPLLLGLPWLGTLFTALREALGDACGISIQTNGVLITDAVLDLCVEHDVTLSVSLDGPSAVHDRFRVDLRQRPTHAKVMVGLQRLQAHPAAKRLFSGVLCVVDPTSNPEVVYDYFKGLAIPSVDFLYRDGNHTVLPFGKASADSSEYGAWMCRILDRYVADATPFRSRLLDDMMRLLLGGVGVKEGIGLTDYGILVIDTDGAVKKNDTLKSSPLGDRFDATWALRRNALADIAASPEFRAYHLAQRPSSPICLACPQLRVCGGGMVTHRFKVGAGYDNPTVFCADQKLLIARMEALLAPYLKERAA